MANLASLMQHIEAGSRPARARELSNIVAPNFSLLPKFPNDPGSEQEAAGQQKRAGCPTEKRVGRSAWEPNTLITGRSINIHLRGGTQKPILEKVVTSRF